MSASQVDSDLATVQGFIGSQSSLGSHDGAMSTAVSAISKLKGYSNICPEHKPHSAKVEEYAGKVASRPGGTYQAKKSTKSNWLLVPLQRSAAVCNVDHSCYQKGGIAYPCLPYLRRGEPMVFDVRVQLVIRPKVTSNG